MQVGVLLEAYTSQIVYFDTSRLWLRWNHHRRHLRWDSGNGLHFSFERPYVTIQSNVASSKIGSRHDRSDLQCTWTQIGSPLRAGPVPCNTNIQSSLNSRMRMLFVLSRLNIDCKGCVWLGQYFVKISPQWRRADVDYRRWVRISLLRLSYCQARCVRLTI